MRPCKDQHPHLTELQKKYKDKGIDFIGVSVWEQDQGKVAPFVKEMGDKMDYRVAIDSVPEGEDGNKGKMAEKWMTASESNGIPTAFIVKGGKIAWIGHPMSMDKPLEKVVSGEFDMAKAVSEFREEKAKEKKMMAVFAKVQKLGQGATPKKIMAIFDAAIDETPSLEATLGLQKYLLMIQLEDAGASAYGAKLVDGPLKEEAESLNQIAWLNVDPDNGLEDAKRDYKLALKAAIKADELEKGENGAILDTLALAYFKNGDTAKAFKAQEKAIKILGDGDEGMKKRLEQYQKAVGREEALIEASARPLNEPGEDIPRPVSFRRSLARSLRPGRDDGRRS